MYLIFIKCVLVCLLVGYGYMRNNGANFFIFTFFSKRKINQTLLDNYHIEYTLFLGNFFDQKSLLVGAKKKLNEAL